MNYRVDKCKVMLLGKSDSTWVPWVQESSYTVKSWKYPAFLFDFVFVF